MRADVFIDTNIVVYSFDADAPAKQRQAKEILAGPGWFVSWLVVREFCSVALHRFAVPLKPEDLRDYVALRLWPRCRVLPGDTLLAKAIEIQGRFGFRFCDSLIISSALAGGAVKLLSEDLQDGQAIGPLQIVNPFR